MRTWRSPSITRPLALRAGAFSKTYSIATAPARYPAAGSERLPRPGRSDSPRDFAWHRRLPDPPPVHGLAGSARVQTIRPGETIAGFGRIPQPLRIASRGDGRGTAHGWRWLPVLPQAGPAHSWGAGCKAAANRKSRDREPDLTRTSARCRQTRLEIAPAGVHFCGCGEDAIVLHQSTVIGMQRRQRSGPEQVRCAIPQRERAEVRAGFGSWM